jgi:hypothetical protein
MLQPIEQRVAQLEKNLRFYKIAFIGIAILAFGFIFMSFDKRNAVPDLLQAKVIQVVDDKGHVLVNLNNASGNGSISTYTPTGTKLVDLFTTDGGAGGINTFSKSGELIFKLTNTTTGGAYLALFNGEGSAIHEMGVTTMESGYFRINDRYGKKLAWMTYTQDGGGYFSLSKDDKEYFRLSTPDVGGRMGIYNKTGTRITYMGAQDTQDGNITVWNTSGTRLGGIPAN